jgi:hypothetical protein
MEYQCCRPPNPSIERTLEVASWSHIYVWLFVWL